MIEKKQKYGGNGWLFAALTAIAPICGCDSLDQVGDFVGGIPFTDPDGEDPTTNEPALTEFLPTGTLLNYDVEIVGMSAWGGTFIIDAVISIQPAFATVTTNDFNPFEVFLAAGRPSAIPEAGAIQYATNSAFYVSTPNFDLSLVSIVANQSTVSLQPAQDSLGFEANQNHFTIESGISAEVFLITRGQIVLEFSDAGKTIKGLIDVDGIGVLFFTPGGSYSATFEGTLRE